MRQPPINTHPLQSSTTQRTHHRSSRASPRVPSPYRIDTLAPASQDTSTHTRRAISSRDCLCCHLYTVFWPVLARQVCNPSQSHQLDILSYPISLLGWWMFLQLSHVIGPSGLVPASPCRADPRWRRIGNAYLLVLDCPSRSRHTLSTRGRADARATWADLK